MMKAPMFLVLIFSLTQAQTPGYSWDEKTLTTNVRVVKAAAQDAASYYIDLWDREVSPDLTLAGAVPEGFAVIEVDDYYVVGRRFNSLTEANKILKTLIFNYTNAHIYLWPSDDFVPQDTPDLYQQPTNIPAAGFGGDVVLQFTARTDHRCGDGQAVKEHFDTYFGEFVWTQHFDVLEVVKGEGCVFRLVSRESFADHRQAAQAKSRYAWVKNYGLNEHIATTQLSQGRLVSTGQVDQIPLDVPDAYYVPSAAAVQPVRTFKPSDVLPPYPGGL